MNIGYKVAYVMTSANGAITHNSERFTAEEFGSMREARDMAQWCADSLKDAPHIHPVVITELTEREYLEGGSQDAITVPIGMADRGG